MGLQSERGALSSILTQLKQKAPIFQFSNGLPIMLHLPCLSNKWFIWGLCARNSIWLVTSPSYPLPVTHSPCGFRYCASLNVVTTNTRHWIDVFMYDNANGIIIVLGTMAATRLDNKTQMFNTNCYMKECDLSSSSCLHQFIVSRGVGECN